MQLSNIQRVEHRDIEHRIVDRNIYFLQHYLVESLARCTSKITVVVLKNSTTLAKVTEEWKKKSIGQSMENYM